MSRIEEIRHRHYADRQANEDVRWLLSMVFSGAIRRFRSYYRINRETWPEMSRLGAALDALRLTRRVR